MNEKKPCPFKFQFASSKVIKCCLIIDIDCPNEDKCQIKSYREEQRKIWKRKNGSLVKRGVQTTLDDFK